jgi:hypothetical protein
MLAGVLCGAIVGLFFHREDWSLRTATISLIVAAITMPICCFLTARKKPFRHLFPIPVVAPTTGILAVLLGWSRP